MAHVKLKIGLPWDLRNLAHGDYRVDEAVRLQGAPDVIECEGDIAARTKAQGLADGYGVGDGAREIVAFPPDKKGTIR